MPSMTYPRWLTLEKAPSGRRLSMGIGQPGMEREHGDLDGESQGKGPKEPVLSPDGNSEFVELENIKGSFSNGFCTDEVQGQDSNEHQYTSSHCKEEEFNGRIDPPLRVTPDTDE